MRKALQGRASAEVRRRLEPLIEKQKREAGNPSANHLRVLRAVEILELVATPDAKKLLETLAAGAPEARLTQEAKASMGRLAKRTSATP
jgi:hypothetical protein